VFPSPRLFPLFPNREIDMKKFIMLAVLLSLGVAVGCAPTAGTGTGASKATPAAGGADTKTPPAGDKPKEAGK
jgi:hypothetical protein